MKCRTCKAKTEGNMYCSARCRYVWHNHNRELTPNVVGPCMRCGKPVSRWVSPSRLSKRKRVAVYCDRTCAGAERVGKMHPNWRGGRKIDKDGYVLIWRPRHPHAVRGYVREHRIVMEKHIGRRLKRTEVVHHIDGNKANNDIANLHLYRSNADHKRDDAAVAQRGKGGRWKKGAVCRKS